MVGTVVVLNVRIYEVLGYRNVEEKTNNVHPPTYMATLGSDRATPPITQTPNFISQSLGFLVFHFVLKKITYTISKTQMSLVEGRAENTWVPPEGQHQGLHGPPTSPTLEQLGVHGPGSYTDPRLPSSHLGVRWESELSPPINKCSPNPATGTRAQLGFGETTSAAGQQPKNLQSPQQNGSGHASKLS